MAIGNFDGVHRGHQQLVRSAVSAARATGLRAVALTFEPHPHTVFAQRDPATFRLQTSAQRAATLRALGVDHVETACFDRQYAALPAESFVRDELIGRLGAVDVHVGPDYAFGHQRVGNVAMLTTLMGQHGGRVSIADVVLESGDAVSSTRLRALLTAGELVAFSSLCGRSWALDGPVQSGAGRGRTIGIPTLNLYPEGQLLPPRGVYGTRLTARGCVWPSITNLGVRPTFSGDPRVSCESFVLDDTFTGVAVDEWVRVEFDTFVRPERRFAGADELVAQIARDIEAVRGRR